MTSAASLSRLTHSRFLAYMMLAGMIKIVQVFSESLRTDDVLQISSVADLYAYKADVVARSLPTLPIYAVMLRLIEIQPLRGVIRLAYTMALVLGCGLASAILSSFAWPQAPTAVRIGSSASVESWFWYTFWADIVVGMLAVVIADRWRARDRAIEYLTAVQEQGRSARQRLVQVRLLSIQTRIDPQLVFDTLAAVKSFYETDAARAERLLDDLTAFLRAALPRLRSERSLLELEFALVEAYAQLLRTRHGLGRQISLRVSLPPALRDAIFPPALLLPLVTLVLERSGPEGRIEMVAEERGDAICVRVLSAARLDQKSLESMRTALVDLYEERAAVRLHIGEGPTSTVELEVPHEHG
ncbi:histidine kinase [Variovorax sp. J22R133]|uniref:sensor histidine kinase n=1 Tax=Variovorax brevis TaxID=3053503 RepID=UPI0025751E20|nr:histidine kinase [Variovorax sp. J22R133]MDM0110525.1 histidine kinase [Variovorax sp. J22R133]